jgi:hypothetical protein
MSAGDRLSDCHFSPPSSSIGRPALAARRRPRGQLGAQPVELVGGQPAAIARIIDQRARWPRRVFQQVAVPGAAALCVATA